MPASVTVAASGNQDIDGLLTGTRWASGNLDYSFPASSTYYPNPYSPDNEPTTNFGALSAVQQASTAAVLAQFADVANLNFSRLTETSTNHATLRYALSDAAVTAHAYYPSDDAKGLGGDVWLNNSSGAYANPVRGTYAWDTLLHETGHALGLKHGQDAEGGFPSLPSAHDSLEFSVMTYRAYEGAPTTGGYPVENAGYPQTLMMNDIAALQYMYGADFTTNAGDTTYSWDPSTGQEFVNGVGQGAPAGNRVLMTVWDGGGHDSYDLSNYTNDLTIDLRPGGWSTLSPGQLAHLDYFGSDTHLARGNVANALLYNNDQHSLIEDAFGGSGNDVLFGNDAANLLVGGAGRDTLIGGAGADVMRGGLGDDLYSVDDLGDRVIELPGQGYDEIYSSVNLTMPDNVETLFLTGSARSATGNAGNNAIIGDDAANIIDAGAGDFDFINGLGGDDILIGGAGHDEINGGAGADMFRFTAPSDAGPGGDFIYDFTPGEDHIQFNASAFGLTAVTDGTTFISGNAPAPVQAGPTLEYNNLTGFLFYDADGTGSGAPIVLALLNGVPQLHASDFAFY